MKACEEASGRKLWLDEIRLIAILVMVVDHSLLFLAEGHVLSVLVRTTFTRCAEPLFVYVFATLAGSNRRPMRMKRWLQIAAVSVVTSMLLTRQVGYAMIDILGSLAVVAPLVVMTARLHRRYLLVCMYVLAVLAPFPVTCGGVRFDYSPALVGYQFLLVRLMYDSANRNSVFHGVMSGFVVFLLGTTLKPFHVDALPAIMVVVIGHPLAWIFVRWAKLGQLKVPKKALTISRWPLTVYALHLIALAFLSP